jgi:hypothetical protein
MSDVTHCSTIFVLMSQLPLQGRCCSVLIPENSDQISTTPMWIRVKGRSSQHGVCNGTQATAQACCNEGRDVLARLYWLDLMCQDLSAWHPHQ